MIGISERGKLGTRRRLQANDVVDGNTFWFLVLTIIGPVPLIRGVNSGLTYVLNLHRENSLFTYNYGLGIFSLILVLPAAARHVRDVKFKWSPLFCLPIGYISLILLYIFIFRPLAWRADYYPNRMASQILTCWWGWLP